MIPFTFAVLTCMRLAHVAGTAADLVVVKAAALALQEVPEANSAWLGETIRQ